MTFSLLSCIPSFHIILLSVLALLLLIVVFLIVAIVIPSRGFKRCTSEAKMDGKVVLITGASAGIGKEAARDFARRGAKVIMACRNLTKAQKVADDIIATTGNKNVLVQELDTSLLESVRKFAQRFLETENRLDILALNAGITGPTHRTLTAENLEITMATNHFGHLLLTCLLAGILKKSAPCRVVVTSSQAHKHIWKLNSQDLNFEYETYGGMKAYSFSKLCNVFFTKYAAELFSDFGITINCFCPGLVATEIFEKGTILIMKIMKHIAPFFGFTPEEGAQTLIYLALSEEVKNVSGRFFVFCQEREANSLSSDAGLAKKVWETSEHCVHLQPEERRF